MRSPSCLLDELGDCELNRLIEMTDSPHLTERDHADAGKWLFGYLLCLRDFGRITAEEFDALASEPRRAAATAKLKE